MLRRIDPLQGYADVGGQKLVDAIKFCQQVNEKYERRYLSRRQPSTVWHEVGRVRQVVRDQRSARLECENGWVELFWAAADCLRVRLRTLDGNFVPPQATAVIQPDPGALALEFSENDDTFEMHSSALLCRVSKTPFRLWLETLPDHRLVCADSVGIHWGDLGDVRLSLALAQDETCYGLGMRASALNLRGRRLRLFNSDPGGYQRDSDPLTYSVPFYLGVKDSLSCGVFWDNPNRGTVEVGSSLSNELLFEAESGELRCFLIAGDDAGAVLSRYSDLIGRGDLPPLWALGYGQAQFSYSAPQDLPRLAAEFRSHGVLCTALYLDHAQSRWDAPRLKQVIAELHALDFKVIATLTPGIPLDEASGIDRRLLLRYPDGQPLVGATWLGVCCFPDFTQAQDYWTRRIAPLVEAGVDGIALELAEPTVLGASGKPETLPDYAEQGTLYAAHLTHATEAALRQLRPDQRPVIVTHSGAAGSPGLVSTGGNAATWEHLRLSIPMILNMSLSGLPLSGANVGGYYGDCDGELFTRWLQVACLLPLLRADSFAGTQPKHPSAFGQPYERINRLTLELRAKLLPYLYAQIALFREYGLPVIRPLFMLDPALREVDDAYLLGDILVAPILDQGLSGRTLHLPQGLWYDYWTNEAITGGCVIDITAALDRLPLFVRAGAALPEMLPSAETLLLRVYPGDGETVHYEDSGEGRAADYRWCYTTCAWDEDVRFSISRRTAGRFQPPYKLIRVEVVGLTEEPVDVRLDRQSAPLWYFDNGVLELTAEDTFQRIEITRRSVPGDRTLTHRPW